MHNALHIYGEPTKAICSEMWLTATMEGTRAQITFRKWLAKEVNQVFYADYIWTLPLKNFRNNAEKNVYFIIIFQVKKSEPLCHIINILQPLSN